MLVHAIDHPQVPPLAMPDRFKHDVAYFMTPPGERGAPAKLPAGEYWIDPDDAATWLADGVLSVYSPLDSDKQAELEITEDQELFLDWLKVHGVRHIRLVAER